MLAKKLLSRLIYAVIVIQIALTLVDRFPPLLSVLVIVSHAIYAGNLRRFPFVKLTDPLFLLSCVLVILNHYLWFRHFSTPPTIPPLTNPRYGYKSSRYDQLDVPSFTEIASYFGICVWLVPFSLFVSLTASENVLPSMGSEYATGDSSGIGVGGGGDGKGKKGGKGLVRVAVDGVREWVGETGEVMGFWRGDRTKRF